MYIMETGSLKKHRLFNRCSLYIAVVVLITSVYLTATIPHIDDIASNETSQENVLNASAMADSGSDLDSIEDGSLVIRSGEGLKMFTGQISLENSDALNVHFKVLNKSDRKVRLTVDLYGDNFDDPYDEFKVKVPSGEHEVSQEIAFYRNMHPDACSVRIFTETDAEVVIEDFAADYLTVTRDGNSSLLTAARCMRVIAMAAIAFLIMYLFFSIRDKRISVRAGRQDVLMYLSIALCVTGLLLLLYRNADISYPLIYAGGDEMGVYYFAKTIDQNGISLVNPFVGGISGGDLFDYPYSDSLSFAIVKLIGLSSDNPFLIINLFYFTNAYLIALITAAVSRKAGLSRISSFVVGLLFAFSPFFQLRYPHMWLTAYYMLPVACLLSINIIKGVIPGEDDKNRRRDSFWHGMLMAFMCSFTGMYYAYFACAIFAAAMVIRIINTQGKGLKKEIYPIAYIGSTILGVLVNVAPNLIYWALNGTNPSGELSIRCRWDAETYGLKLVQLILPRQGHRIGLFSRIADGYARNYPLVNENNTAAIGIIASLGLLISLLLLFYDRNKHKEISWLNLSAFIIATIGGIGSIISVAIVIPMRCYNRMSLIIMFLSLLMIGKLLDSLRERAGLRIVMCISLCILMAGIFDQTADFAPYDLTAFNSTRQFFNQVESEMDDGDSVYSLPYLEWPSSGVAGSYGMFTGYLETDDLHWSYGAMQGREEAQWQKVTATLSAAEMVEKLKYAGYDGIYLNKELYDRKFGGEGAVSEQAVEQITAETGTAPVISEDKEKYFWKIESAN